MRVQPDVAGCRLVKPLRHGGYSAPETVPLSVLMAVAQPALLSRVGGQRDDHAREEGTAECGTPAARSGNDLLSVKAPVCRADPQRACDVREDVDDHQDPPDAEAESVQAEEQSATVPEDERTNNLLAGGVAGPTALTDGFKLAFWVGGGLAVIALATTLVVLKRDDLLPKAEPGESRFEEADDEQVAA
jgi:hypothetical protein